jgi:hypothetical protein
VRLKSGLIAINTAQMAIVFARAEEGRFCGPNCQYQVNAATQAKR